MGEGTGRRSTRRSLGTRQFDNGVRRDPALVPSPAEAVVSAPAPTRLEFERRIAACPTLPTLPAVALQILRLCREADVDLWKIADAVSTDAALAARVLRAANSASQAARGKVTTITRAVALLGSNAIVSVSLSFALLRARRNDRASGFDRAVFWKRSVFSALGARAMAEVTAPIVDPEEAFIAALLQDLGMLALAEVFEREYGQLFSDAGGDHDALAALERQAWGGDHAVASAMLARSWSLPLALELPIASSHEPAPGDPASVEGRLARCVALSGRVADVWVAPAGPDTRRALELARERLGLSPSALEAILARMAMAVPETSADFEIDLGGVGRVDEVLAEARRLLEDRGLAPVRCEQGAAHLGRDPLSAPLQGAFAYARARGAPVALVVVVRDPGDRLRAGPLGPLLQPLLRRIDLLEELDDRVLVLLPDTELPGAQVVAARLLERARAGGAAAHVGVAALVPRHPGGTFEELWTRAAEAAAAARARGRGVVVTAPEPVAAGGDGA